MRRMMAGQLSRITSVISRHNVVISISFLLKKFLSAALSVPVLLPDGHCHRLGREVSEAAEGIWVLKNRNRVVRLAPSCSK